MCGVMNMMRDSFAESFEIFGPDSSLRQATCRSSLNRQLRTENHAVSAIKLSRTLTCHLQYGYWVYLPGLDTWAALYCLEWNVALVWTGRLCRFLLSSQVTGILSPTINYVGTRNERFHCRNDGYISLALLVEFSLPELKLLRYVRWWVSYLACIACTRNGEEQFTEREDQFNALKQ